MACDLFVKSRYMMITLSDLTGVPIEAISQAEGISGF
jgi:hypothetical protein